MHGREKVAPICTSIQMGSNFPPGGKLNPRFVCSWRSYDRHWMPNAWFWHTFQLMIFAVPLCFGFFSCVLQCFLHSWASKSSVFFFLVVVFLKYAGFSTSLRASYKLLDKDATTYQERLTSYKTKILQRIRNVFQVTGRRSYKVSGNVLQRIRNVWQVTGRRSYNVSGTSYKLLDEDLTTYQERLTSYWTKILQRIRNVLQVTGRISYNVSGTSDKLLDEDLKDLTTYQERLTSYWTKMLGRRCFKVSRHRDWHRRPQDVITSPRKPPQRHPNPPPQNPPKNFLLKKW